MALLVPHSCLLVYLGCIYTVSRSATLLFPVNVNRIIVLLHHAHVCDRIYNYFGSRKECTKFLVYSMVRMSIPVSTVPQLIRPLLCAPYSVCQADLVYVVHCLGV